jgi:hypothetical protein
MYEENVLGWMNNALAATFYSNMNRSPNATDSVGTVIVCVSTLGKGIHLRDD